MDTTSVQRKGCGTAAWQLWLVLAVLVLTGSSGGGISPGELEALRQWRAGATVGPEAVQAFGEERCFASQPLTDEVFSRIRGKSYVENPHIGRADLRHVRALHYDAGGSIHIGEMVCHKDIADDLVQIFRRLYDERYPIGRMVLIDEYDADDHRSMLDNNSSCFCYRTIKGMSRLSKHALGRAVDINSLYNPYCKRRADGTLAVQPPEAAAYADRTGDFPYKIVKGDLCHRLFLQHGFHWGGTWRSGRDYQHFEK